MLIATYVVALLVSISMYVVHSVFAYSYVPTLEVGSSGVMGLLTTLYSIISFILGAIANSATFSALPEPLSTMFSLINGALLIYGLVGLAVEVLRVIKP